MRRIGVLNTLLRTMRWQTRVTEPFCKACNKRAGPSGANVQVETRWAAGDAIAFARISAELVALAPDVILATGTRPRRHCYTRPALCRSCS